METILDRVSKAPAPRKPLCLSPTWGHARATQTCTHTQDSQHVRHTEPHNTHAQQGSCVSRGQHMPPAHPQPDHLKQLLGYPAPPCLQANVLLGFGSPRTVCNLEQFLRVIISVLHCEASNVTELSSLGLGLQMFLAKCFARGVTEKVNRAVLGPETRCCWSDFICTWT